MARKKDKGGGDTLDANGWMATFSDLVTLLLTFFVMLLSMSSMDLQQMDEAFSNFTSGSGVLEYTDLGEIPNTRDELAQLSKLNLDQIPKEEILRDIFLGKTKHGAEAILSEMKEDIQIKRTPEGVALVFGAKLLFKPGDSEMSENALRVLAKLVTIMKQIDRPISIEGHTDDIIQGPGSKYQTNWDLSMARSLAVRDVLVDRFGVNPSRTRVAAMADSRPVVENTNAENRALNRRIEIVFMWLS